MQSNDKSILMGVTNEWRHRNDWKMRHHSLFLFSCTPKIWISTSSSNLGETSFCHSRRIFSICRCCDPRAHTYIANMITTHQLRFIFIYFISSSFSIKPHTINFIFKESQWYFLVCIFKFSKEQHRLQALRPWGSHMNDDNETSIQNYPHSSKIDNYIQFLWISSMENMKFGWIFYFHL